jgi:hypothetical protein
VSDEIGSNFSHVYNKTRNVMTLQLLSNSLSFSYATVAYLLHASTVEPEKQPLLSNTRTQQYNNGIMQPVSEQWLGKHVSIL